MARKRSDRGPPRVCLVWEPAPVLRTVRSGAKTSGGGPNANTPEGRRSVSRHLCSGGNLSAADSSGEQILWARRWRACVGLGDGAALVHSGKGATGHQTNSPPQGCGAPRAATLKPPLEVASPNHALGGERLLCGSSRDVVLFFWNTPRGSARDAGQTARGPG